MKKLLALLSFVCATTVAQAEYRLIVPQSPGGGTSVWSNMIAPHLSQALGEPVIVQHIPGASDIPGFNKFQNELQKDPKTIMVAHGGNAESFLTDQVDYNYANYDPIAMVNLNIAVSRRTDFDIEKDHIKFGSTSGRRPDVMAIVMMACGPMPSTDAYIDCYKKRMTFVKGMKPTDARLAALRGELNITRETFVSHKKFIEPQVQKGVFVDWFNHGVLDLKTGKIVQDKNFASMPTFEQAYTKRWGAAPQGEFYDSYVLVKSYRDVLQKSLWVGRGNPNATRIRAAVVTMLNNPEALAAIIKDGGNYEWLIGDDMVKAYTIISNRVTEPALKNLYKFTVDGMGLDAVYKSELIKGKK
jgi:hypothetical protein